MKKYDTILFDADGTLFDFLASEREALILALRRFSVDVDEEGIRLYSQINDSLWKALERGEIEKDVLRVRRFEIFGREYGFTCDFDALSYAYTDALTEQMFMIDGAVDICRSLSKKYRMYIVTNGIEYVQRTRFERSPIKDFFDGVFISGEVGYEKPDIRFFKTVEDRIPDFSKEKTIIIGDSLTSDMKGGLNFGIDCCYYNPEGKKPPEDMAIKYTITELSELLEILK